MMMRKLFSIAGVAIAATLLFAACSSDSDDEPTPAPLPPASEQSEVPMGNDERPDWSNHFIDYSLWTQEMSVSIAVQGELADSASTGDMACALVNGEIRAWDNAPQKWENTVKFALNIVGEANSGMVTLKYYSAKLHRIFTVESWRVFNENTPPTDGGKPYIPEFYKTTKTE